MENRPTGPPGTVALAGAEFGWGSTGKLSAVIAALRNRSPRPLRFIGLASGIGRGVLAEHGVERWYDVSADDRRSVLDIARREDVTVGLVVLEGPAAMALEAAGVPTVFVDSLPFLWTEADRDSLPLDASVYCAQRCVELPEGSRGVLSSIRNLRWVEAVVARSCPGNGPGDGNGTGGRFGSGPGVRPSAGPPVPLPPPRRALVSLGGLRSPTLPDWTRYPYLVVPPVLSALESQGVREVHVAGNLPGEYVPEPVATPRTEVTYGPLAHGAFLDRLATADILLTSPGLTTLLEAGALARPAVCLPPQNLSQILNGRFHSRAVGTDVRVRWPERVFSETGVLTDRTGAEESALRVIYGGIAAAAEDAPRTRAEIQDGVLAALRRARSGAVWTGLTDTVGSAGAAQVADHVLALLHRTPTAAAG
ncbi:hydroxymethylcytosylglucuronate/cytosylglucuronate synthase [Streptomyces sp. NPDC000594]|uniref:hydroxymethylcytosylglucuronate/cytosylglucurona te synthase n=1 Tax=Streptomyces sp. NPDC000594 TaxID=3154261 RepID=UPI00331F6E5F